MTHVSGSNASHIQKTLLKAGLAAAAPGIVALTAAFTAPVNILQQYAGMGSMGVAAMGVIFGRLLNFFDKKYFRRGLFFCQRSLVGWNPCTGLQRLGPMGDCQYCYTIIISLLFA